jgi:hypothetical protein
MSDNVTTIRADSTQTTEVDVESVKSSNSSTAETVTLHCDLNIPIETSSTESNKSSEEDINSEKCTILIHGKPPSRWNVLFSNKWFWIYCDNGESNWLLMQNLHLVYDCSLRSRRLVQAGEERASLNKRLPKCLWQICSAPKNLRKSFALVNLVNGSNYVTQMSTTILLAYRNSDSDIFLIKNMPVNDLEETLSYISSI